MIMTTSKSVRYHALDIWRGLVCLVVVVEHAGICLLSATPEQMTAVHRWIRAWITLSLSLNLGAPLFFVISGYCIAASLDSTRRKGISPARFLARRLWRIFPPYWASMAVIALLVVLLNYIGLRHWHQTNVGLELFDPSTFDLNQWVGNFSLTEQWRHSVFHGSPMRFLNRVAWALCYQEQFYFVCFLALVFLPNRLYGALATATLLITGFRWWVATTSIPGFEGLFPDLWHEFAVGLFMYWRINVAENFWSKRAIELGFASLLAFGSYQLWVFGLEKDMVTTTASAMFGLMLIFFHRWDLVIARIKQLDPLRALGKRSYSVYLIHLPVCTIGNAALADLGMGSFWLRLIVMIPTVTAGSVLAGWLFYAGVDRHFSNLPIVSRFSRWVKPPQPGVAVPHAQV